MIDTKQKIMDVAERLFGEQGYDATSLRHIIAEAGVNLAAVHYHFGSKEDLLLEVVLRKINPVNQERMALLDQIEAEAAPNAPTVEKVLEAFLAPAIHVSKSPEFVKLMGRLHAEGSATEIFHKHFEPMITRFRTALSRAVPELSERELEWRSHFMVGAMAHMFTGRPHLRETLNRDDPRLVIDYLIAFLSGGFHAPAVEPVEAAVREEK
jgi:AcrR family transcriptional regulator